VDGMANGLGYGMILILVAFVRELLGTGKILGMNVIPEFLIEAGYQNMGLMVLAPGAFFIIGLLVWLKNSLPGISHDGKR
jgi:Na+-transporting NADH:ubiquinone oxidoreductase subunit D